MSADSLHRGFSCVDGMGEVSPGGTGKLRVFPHSSGVLENVVHPA